MSEEYKVNDRVWFEFAFSASYGVIRAKKGDQFVIQHGYSMVDVIHKARILGHYTQPPKKWWQFWRGA